MEEGVGESSHDGRGRSGFPARGGQGRFCAGIALSILDIESGTGNGKFDVFDAELEAIKGDGEGAVGDVGFGSINAIHGSEGDSYGFRAFRRVEVGDVEGYRPGIVAKAAGG